MMEADWESLVKIRVVALDYAIKMLREGTVSQDRYLDEAKAMMDFLHQGRAPLPDPDRVVIPDGLGELNFSPEALETLESLFGEDDDEQ